MVDCKTVLSLLPADLLGEIHPMTVLLIAEHLKGCRSCSIAYESARETVEDINRNEFQNAGPVFANCLGVASGEAPSAGLRNGDGK